MSILVLTSDTLIGTPAAGNLEYNGQFFGTDSNTSRAQMQRITQGTAVASTSGTSIDFTSIPAWVKRITVMFEGVSTNGTSPFIIQVGDSGGVETTAYTGSAIRAVNADVTNAYSFSTGFIVTSVTAAASTSTGIATIVLQSTSSALWVFSYTGALTNAAVGFFSAGNKTLSATLDRVRITTVNGTDTFDAGSINILYEG